MLIYLPSPRLFLIFMSLCLYTHFQWLEYIPLSWLPGKKPSYSSFNLHLQFDQLSVVIWLLTSPGKKGSLLYGSAPSFGITTAGLCCRLIPPCISVPLVQLWSALCDPRDCNLPGSSVCGIFQARVLAWVAISFSRESSSPRIEPASCVSPPLQVDSLPAKPSGKSSV